MKTYDSNVFAFLLVDETPLLANKQTRMDDAESKHETIATETRLST